MFSEIASKIQCNYCPSLRVVLFPDHTNFDGYSWNMDQAQIMVSRYSHVVLIELGVSNPHKEFYYLCSNLEFLRGVA